MRGVHHTLVNSRFADRYLAVQRTLGKVKHLIHGGVESFYAGLPIEHLLSHGFDRLSDEAIEQTLENIEIGSEAIRDFDIAEGELYLHCGERPTQGEKTREAVWQCGIFANYRQVAALGINFHQEDGTVVGTVANVQGHDSEGVMELAEICGGTPWPVKTLSILRDALPSHVKLLRGVPSGKHPFRNDPKFNRHSASNLYDRTFRVC